MRMIFNSGAIEIWEVAERHGPAFYVYGILGDPVVCPSLSKAYAVAAKG